MKVGDWIAAQRQKRRPPENTQKWLGEQVGVAQTTISKWEKGKSDVSREELARLEDVFGTTYAADKFSPLAVAQPLRLPVMGIVRARQLVEQAPLDALEYIAAPPGTPEGARCLIVRGASFPPHKDGTALVFWAFVEDPAAFLGELCFVRLLDGAEYVREIARGDTPKTWTLISPVGEPTIRNVEIECAALIEMTVRRPQWITPA